MAFKAKGICVKNADNKSSCYVYVHFGQLAILLLRRANYSYLISVLNLGVDKGQPLNTARLED